jgi:hypothetical protein
MSFHVILCDVMLCDMMLCDSFYQCDDIEKILCFVALYCVALDCIVLYCIVLYCIVLQRSVYLTYPTNFLFIAVNILF